MVLPCIDDAKISIIIYFDASIDESFKVGV